MHSAHIVKTIEIIISEDFESVNLLYRSYLTPIIYVITLFSIAIRFHSLEKYNGLFETVNVGYYSIKNSNVLSYTIMILVLPNNKLRAGPKHHPRRCFN